MNQTLCGPWGGARGAVVLAGLGVAASALGADRAQLVHSSDYAHSATTQLDVFLEPAPWSQWDGEPAPDGQGGVWSTETAVSHGPFSGGGTCEWTVEYEPASPGLFGAWNAVRFFGVAESVSAFSGDGSSLALNLHEGQVVVGFTVVDESRWSVRARVRADSRGVLGLAAYSAILSETLPDGTPGAEVVRISHSAAGEGQSIDHTVAQSGRIAPGSYVFVFTIRSAQNYFQQLGPMGGGSGIALEGGEFRVEAVTTPPCLADFNSVNGVGVQDIYDFLADWSSQVVGGPVLVRSADVDGSGGVAVQDVYEFLALWSAGC